MPSFLDIDCSLYLVTDSELCKGRELINVVLSAVAGGVTMVQLREKNMDAREFADLAKALKICLKSHAVPLIINDRLDIMLISKADGIHVGQTDLNPKDIRTLIGKNAIVGLTVGKFEQIEQAEQFDVDYIGLGPIFETSTKTGLGTPFGIEGAKKARKMTKLPIIGIGGINEKNAHDVYNTGLDGVAVVSAICSAEDPKLAAKNIRAAKKDNLESRLKAVTERKTTKLLKEFSTKNSPIQ